MTTKQLESIILKDGWYRVSSKSSHRQYVHPIKKSRVTIPWHSGKDEITRSLLKRIMQQAGL